MATRFIVFIAIICWNCFPSSLSAQEHIIYGMVVDSLTKKALLNATIKIRTIKKTVVSNINGEFRFNNLSHGQYILDISLIGYRSFSQPIILNTTIIKVQIALLPITLPEILVNESLLQTSDESTRHIHSLLHKEIEQKRGQTLSDLLTNVPGVTLLQTGASIAKPVIRGLHSQRVLVINAGIQQEGQQWGAEHAPEIDPFTPSRLEVLKGASALEYGAGAIGGVIKVFPRELPKSTTLYGECSGNLFSNNRQGAFSTFVEGATGLGISWRLQGSLRRAGDTHTADYVLSNTGFHENSGSFALGYSSDRFSVEVYYSLYDNELGIFRGSHIASPDDLLRAIAQSRPLNNAEFSYAISPPKQTITHDLWSVKSIFRSEIGRFEIRYGWQQNNRNEFDAHNSRLKDSAQLQLALERPAMSLELTTHSFDVQWQHKPLAIAHTTLSGKIGFSASRQSNARSGRVFLIPGFRSYSAGIYAVENYSVGNWLFNAGARFDVRSMPVYAIENRGIPDTTFAFSGLGYALGALWSSAQDDDFQQGKGYWSVTANLSSTWRPPQVNELYSNDVHHGTAQYEIGDPALQPERSFAGDISMRYHHPSLFVELTGFVNSIKNYIVTLPDVHNPTITIRGTFPTFRFTQLQALLQGVETRAIWYLLPELSLSSSYMMVKGSQTDNGEPLYQMPPSRLYSAIDAEIPLLSGQSVFFHAGLLFVQQQTAFMPNSDYAPPPPSYTLVDCSVGAEFLVFSQPVRCSLSINNLGNISYRDYLSRYRYFADDPGRNLIFRLSIPFGEPDQVNQ